MRARTILSTLLLYLSATTSAFAATYTVGPDFDCDFFWLREALVAVANEPGSHAIHVARNQDASLTYSFPNPDAELHLENPVADSIWVEGAYPNCASGLPISTENTTLMVGAIVVDANHSLLTIANDEPEPFAMRFRDITFEGVADTSGEQGPLYGGGLEIQGNVRVVLQYDTTIRNFQARHGGGVALIRYAGFAPELTLMPGTRVEDNVARINGGGIYAQNAKVVLEGGHVDDNVAESGNGGGLWISSAGDPGSIDSHPENVDLTVKGSGLGGMELTSTISGNQAGMDLPISPGQGLGGGIYSEQAWIWVQHGGGVTEIGGHRDPALELINNAAVLGGGLYIEGPQEDVGGPFTDLILYDTRFRQNFARGQGGAMYIIDAVDGEMDSSEGACEFSGEPAPCSMFHFNAASNQDVTSGNPPGGGAVYMTDERHDGLSRPRMRFARTLFDANLDLAGSTAVVAAMSYAEPSFNRSIFRDNSGSGNSVLIFVNNDRDLDFRYNTVLDNDTTRAFGFYGDAMLLTHGSIIWMPGHEVWWHGTDSSMRHNGCLIAQTANELPPGVTVMDPRLGVHLAPRGSSPALDHCDSFDSSPISGIYHLDVVDVPGISNIWESVAPYARDLGAVEQTDIIYANNFGDRATW